MEYKIKRIIYGDGRVVYELWHGIQRNWILRKALGLDNSYYVNDMEGYFYNIVATSLCLGDIQDKKSIAIKRENGRRIISCTEVL